MAQSDNNGNNTNAVHKNGTAKVPFEMPLARSRNHFLQNSVGRRLIAGPDQYVTPPVRSVRMIFDFCACSFISVLVSVNNMCYTSESGTILILIQFRILSCVVLCTFNAIYRILIILCVQSVKNNHMNSHFFIKKYSRQSHRVHRHKTLVPISFPAQKCRNQEV